jgi:hypothetical protein
MWCWVRGRKCDVGVRLAPQVVCQEQLIGQCDSEDGEQGCEQSQNGTHHASPRFVGTRILSDILTHRLSGVAPILA